MKKIVLIFLSLIINISIVYPQTIDCNKLTNGLIDKTDFDEINSSFIQYLLSNTSILKDRDLMNEVGFCWYELIKTNHEFILYTISDDILNLHPGLILLIFNEEYVDTYDEIQSWLDNLKSEENINYVWTLLQEENIRKSRKYKFGKVNIENIAYFDKINEGFFAILIDSIAEPIVSFWYKENQSYRSPVTYRTAKKLVFLYPNNINSVIKKYPTINKFELEFKFNEFKKVVQDLLLVTTNEELNDFKNIEYLSYFWEYFIEDMEGKPTQFANLEQLLTLNFPDYLLGERKEELNNLRLNSLYSINQHLGKFCNSCQYRLESCNNNLEKFDSPHSFLWDFYVLVLYEQNSTCKQCHQDLASYYINMYKSNKDYIKNNFDNFINFSTHYFLADFIINYSNNSTIIDITKELKSLFDKNSTFSKISKYELENQTWYYLLNKCYVDSTFSKFKNLEQLNIESKYLSKGSKIQRFDENEEARMEYLYYYAQYQIIYNKNADINNLLTILNEVKRLGENPSFRTFFYIEKHLANILLKKIEKAQTDKIPPILNIIDVSKVINDSIFETRGNVMDLSAIQSLSINGSPVVLDKDGYFKFIITLSEGLNKIEYIAKDSFDNTTTMNRDVTYVPIKDEFLLRKNYAFLFAVNDYNENTGWADLKNPISDAESISNELVNCGFDTLIIRNPTKRVVQGLLRKYAEKKYGKYDQLLIFYSGHGEFDDMFSRGFLALSDSKQSDIYKDSYFSYADISETLDNISCDHILFISDACFSGTFFKSIASKGKDNKNVFDQRLIKEKLEYKTRLFIGSAGKEESPDVSIFAKALLSALLSLDSKNKVLTYSEIIPYLETLKPQPTNGQFGSNELRGTFIFERVFGK
jgi:hypothetical protein